VAIRYQHLVFLIIVLGAGASLLKSSGLIALQFGEFERNVGGASVLHCAVALLLGFSTAGWVSQRSNETLKLTMLALPFVLVTLDESSQALIATRQFSWLDLALNITCLIIGIGCYRLLKAKQGE
jgi:VanZ family protein